MKQGHGHQTWYELVDPKQGYNHTNASEKGNVKAFAKSENMSIISLEYVGKKNKSDTFMIYLLCLTIPQWGAADAEIKVPSGENTELKCSPFEAWSRSVYSHACCAYLSLIHI